MKNAILVVSFGTTYLDTLEKNIAGTEKHIAQAFTNTPVYRAFTSGIVRSRLMGKYNISVDSIDEALTKILDEGYTEVAIQPTLIIPGDEYDKLCSMASKFKEKINIKIGLPLLRDSSDIDTMIDILKETYPIDNDKILILMGHGTEHKSNDIYIEMNKKMQELKNFSMRLCTVEGKPTFEDMLFNIKDIPQKKAVVAPLMFVAGDHATNDMASDEPNSLRSLLKAAGFTVECKVQGLGELDRIRDIFVKRIMNAKLL